MLPSKKVIEPLSLSLGAHARVWRSEWSVVVRVCRCVFKLFYLFLLYVKLANIV